MGIADEMPPGSEPEPSGTVCVSLNERADFLEEPWLRALLLRTGNAVSGISFDGLVDDSVKCSW